MTAKPGYVATPMIAGLRPPRLLTISPQTTAHLIADRYEHGPTVAYLPPDRGQLHRYLHAALFRQVTPAPTPRSPPSSPAS